MTKCEQHESNRGQTGGYSKSADERVLHSRMLAWDA